MPNSSHVLPDRTGDGFRARLIAVLSALVVANILAWVWTLAAFAGQPVLVGTAVLEKEKKKQSSECTIYHD